MKLSEKKCVPCTGKVPALDATQISQMLSDIEGWQVIENKKLTKTLKFDNFKKAMRLADQIADIAERENHHPDLHVSWGELRIELWTHKIDGLSESDFIMAAKIDEAAKLR